MTYEVEVTRNGQRYCYAPRHGAVPRRIHNGMNACRYCMKQDWKNYWVRSPFRPDQFGWYLWKEGLIDNDGKWIILGPDEWLNRYHRALAKAYA